MDPTIIRATPPLAGLVQVSGGSGEERRGRRLVGRGPGGHVDHALHAGKGLRQTIHGDHVHAAGTRHRHDLVSLRLEHLDDMAADSASRTCYRYLAACFMRTLLQISLLNRDAEHPGFDLDRTAFVRFTGASLLSPRLGLHVTL
jgi:hypothetical protein